ncbi:hypothetical protein [Thalassoroseus pseudoceratinae]|uniref:hypothetical protein n=1 Tax=Thalassoroseus pseudoceratinae TaxID=2713176 RepID=UPI0014225DD3|nr:hypothetical protein [Thalassoroseus pseudoceratinae]
MNADNSQPTREHSVVEPTEYEQALFSLLGRLDYELSRWTNPETTMLPNTRLESAEEMLVEILDFSENWCEQSLSEQVGQSAFELHKAVKHFKRLATQESFDGRSGRIASTESGIDVVYGNVGRQFRDAFESTLTQFASDETQTVDATAWQAVCETFLQNFREQWELTLESV